MSRVTNRVSFAEASDLLERPTRACLGFVLDGRPRVEPVEAVYHDSRFFVGLPMGSEAGLHDTEAVLAIDEGVLFFDLRAICVRGTARRTPEANPGFAWFELEPSKVTCWDYGRLRRHDD